MPIAWLVWYSVYSIHLVPSSTPRALFEPRVQVHLNVTLQSGRNRTASLGLFRCFGKGSLIYPGDFAPDLQPHAGNLEPVTNLFHRARSIGADAGGALAQLLQARG